MGVGAPLPGGAAPPERLCEALLMQPMVSDDLGYSPRPLAMQARTSPSVAAGSLASWRYETSTKLPGGMSFRPASYSSHRTCGSRQAAARAPPPPPPGNID